MDNGNEGRSQQARLSITSSEGRAGERQAAREVTVTRGERERGTREETMKDGGVLLMAMAIHQTCEPCHTAAIHHFIFAS